MSRYFDEEIMHYGVKGMKWRKRKAQYTHASSAAATTRPNRPRARQRFYTKGNSYGVDRQDEKAGMHHNTRPEERANRGLSIEERLSQTQNLAKRSVESKKKKKRAILNKIKATLA